MGAPSTTAAAQGVEKKKRLLSEPLWKNGSQDG
jgi:hypothetical protein